MPIANFFDRQGKRFAITDKKNSAFPFKNHSQFPIILDILMRKNFHHALLTADFSATFYPAFFAAFAWYLEKSEVPSMFKEVEIWHLDGKEFDFDEIPALENEFHNAAKKESKYTLIAFTSFASFINGKFADHFKRWLACSNYRFLLLTGSENHTPNEIFDTHFSTLKLNSLTKSDTLDLLKSQRAELEHFHHIAISDDLLSYAYALVERYLSTEDVIEKTLLLLDSSAARMAALDRTEENTLLKPALSICMLTNVLSDWIQIPASHLQLNKFKMADFIQDMQYRVFGQDIAISLIGQTLQRAHANLQPYHSPFSSLLFAGPAHCGKKTTALAIAENLFQQTHMVYSVQDLSTSHSLSNLFLQRHHDKKRSLFKDIIQQTPYAIIIFDQIEQASPTILKALQEVLHSGYLYDNSGKCYSLAQAILIFCTAIGEDKIRELTESLASPQEADVNLMQLVMSDKKTDALAITPKFSANEFIEAVFNEISTRIPFLFCHQLTIIPFLPLNKNAIEHIIRRQLLLLGKKLASQFNIEFGYAPEVIRYLTTEAGNRMPNTRINPIANALKQVFFVIEQSMLNQPESKNRPNQLFLQLNETGQLLRCDWMILATVRHHAT